MAYCSACGHLIPNQARFCGSCGAAQDVQEEESQPNTAAKSLSAQVATFADKTTSTPSSSGRWKKVLISAVAALVAIMCVTIGLAYWISRAYIRSPPSQQSTTPQQARNIQTPDFGSDQNDPEGYGRHAWNSTVDEFKQSVMASRKASSPTYGDDDFKKESTETPPEFRDSFLPYILRRAMEYLAQVPSVGTNGYFADEDLTFGDFNTLFDNSEHVYYCFVDNGLAFISTSVDSDPTDALRAKYRFIKQSSFTSGDRLFGRYDIDLFKRGDTNTRIYSVYYTAGDTPIHERFLIYIPSSTLYQFGAVVSAKVQAREQRKLKQQQAAQQSTDSKVQ